MRLDGIPVMMKELASILMLDGITCTGHTSKENIDEFKNKNTDCYKEVYLIRYINVGE